MNALLLFIALFLSSSFQDTRRLLKVSIYYEALCSDSVQFIKDQLYPTYSKIGSYLIIDLVPYGKATHTLMDNQWTFNCHHGLSECIGNKYQACGLAMGKSQDKEVEYINCMMGTSDPSSHEAVNICAPKLGVSQNDISNCYHSERSNKLLAKYGDQTQKVQPRITFVPTIIFNDSFDSEIQKLSLTDLFGTACDALNNKPAECQKRCT